MQVQAESEDDSRLWCKTDWQVSKDIEPVESSHGAGGSGGMGSVTMARGHLEALWCDDVKNSQIKT